jgi:hypothetical protein
MKSVFDKTTRDELIQRIQALDESSTAQWGEMTLFQMLRHCTLWQEWVLGKTTYKQQFLGRLLGKMALKGAMKEENAMPRNASTYPAFKVKETTGDIPSEKRKWISLLEECARFSNPNFVHTFFGKMTEEQIGYFAYKHTDHHLRQFGG